MINRKISKLQNRWTKHLNVLLVSDFLYCIFRLMMENASMNFVSEFIPINEIFFSLYNF